MEALAPFAAVFALAFLCESLTEYFFADPLEGLGIDTKYLRYIAAAVGVGLALLYGLDALRDFLGLNARIFPLGEVLTGQRLLIDMQGEVVHRWKHVAVICPSIRNILILFTRSSRLW